VGRRVGGRVGGCAAACCRALELLACQQAASGAGSCGNGWLAELIEADCPALPAACLLLRCRCEHRPSVCADHRARKQYQKALPEGGSQLVAYGEEVFASQADCCRPGLGGFAGGCTTTWF
jgi:hypothetical protein